MSRTKKGSKGPGFEFWTARPGNRHGGGVGKYAKRITHKIERQQNKPTKGDVVIAMQDLAEARDVCGAPCCEYCGTTHNVEVQRDSGSIIAGGSAGTPGYAAFLTEKT